jgi:hypothetical protein
LRTRRPSSRCRRRDPDGPGADLQLSKPAHVQIRKVAGAGVRHEVYLIDPPNKVVLRAQIAPQGTNLSYSFSNCTRANAPGG